ncbi:MAG: hypothetical protein KAF91_00205 [Nostoc sp. TH1S01]|nr:hypothetical protein [Nostoc sp. TH1S01]
MSNLKIFSTSLVVIALLLTAAIGQQQCNTMGISAATPPLTTPLGLLFN